jgi:hypothetical protein
VASKKMRMPRLDENAAGDERMVAREDGDGTRQPELDVVDEHTAEREPCRLTHDHPTPLALQHRAPQRVASVRAPPATFPPGVGYFSGKVCA